MLYNDDCFNIFPNLKNNSINLILLDLPYGQIACEWDVEIDLNKMWAELKRICKKNCIFVFFCTTKFGNKLINSNPKWFRYDLVWEKTNKLGWLSAKNSPLRKHEMIYIFSDKDDDLKNSYNLELRAYAEKLRKDINKPNKEINKDMGNRAAEHFLDRYKTTQFGIPTEKTYNALINKYKIDSLSYYIPYKELRSRWDSDNKDCYNPQMTKGKPFKGNNNNGKAPLYGMKKMIKIDNKGTRYPNSVLKFKYDKESLHPTQKPVKLCEWLIKTYSNKGDTVLDFCMGSGSTGVACINTNRKFIGIEKDKKIFEVAKKRLCTE